MSKKDYMESQPVDERLYRERIAEPVLSFYKDVLYMHHYSSDDIDRLAAEKSQLLSQGNYAAIPILNPFVFSSCTFSCKHCALMIPSLNNFSIDFSIVKEQCDKLFDLVDEVIQFNPASGEVLLYRDLEKLLDYALNHSKVNTVSVFTNGTVIPRESLIPFMTHPKFILMITDYGNLKQQAELLEFCEKNSIITNIKDVTWFPVDYRPHGRTKEELKSLFAQCSIGKTCKTIYNGRLYHCNEMASMIVAGLAEPGISNSLDFMDEKIEKEDYLRFATAEYLETCDLCSMHEKDATRILPAEQKSGELFRSAHAIVNRAEWQETQEYLKLLVEGKDWLEGQYLNYKNLYEEIEKTSRNVDLVRSVRQNDPLKSSYNYRIQA